MQNKKRIYISTYDDINNPHYGGGGAIAVHELAKRLKKKHDVIVLSWDYCGKKKDLIDGVTYERFGTSHLSPKVAMFTYQLLLPFIAMRKKYDIWFESFSPPFTTSMMPLFIKNPVVGIVHMLAAEDMERKYKLPFHIIQNMGIKQYKHLIVTSEALKEKVKKLHPSGSIAVISNGITSVVNPNYNKEKYILFLGRIEVDQKGLDLLIPAFKEVNQVYNSYTLMIVGDGDSNELIKLHELIKKAGLTKEIIVKKKIKGKDKTKLLQKASCVVVPSRFETYSLVSLEAMANGTPVVCFDLEGLSWISHKMAKKVKSLNSSSLAKAISEIIGNKKLSHSMIVEGNAYAKQLTWDKIAKEYSTYISKIV